MKEKDEGDFLHSLMNPLAIASGLLEIVVETSQRGDGLAEADRKRVQKAHEALCRVIDLVRNRQIDLFGPCGDEPKDFPNKS